MSAFKKKLVLVSFLIFFSTLIYAQKKEIALTIDDLPFVGTQKNFHLNKIIQTLQGQRLPATGFIIAGKVGRNNWQMLEKFRDAGFGLGNHTVTHINLNRVGAEAYINEIEAADKFLFSLLTEPKYFRFPYLAMSSGTKKAQVLNYLYSKGYRVAPITIDPKDFVFNQILLGVSQNQRRNFLPILKAAYLEFIWQQTLQAEERNRLAHKEEQSQVLLIHANLLNAYVLPDIIHLYREHGYTFVSLEEALSSFKSSKPRPQNKKSEYDNQIEHYKEWDELQDI